MALFLSDEDQTKDSPDCISFNPIKFNKRSRPSKEKTLVIGCFSEFGCETIGCLYCIPMILKRYPGRYVIAMGWYGREYLYRHLVDEFWELNEEYMFLRDKTYAFHYDSPILQKIERAAAKYGQLIPSSALGSFAIGNYCRTCGKFWNEWRHKTEFCPVCKSTVIANSLFADPKKHKEKATKLPYPSTSKLEWAKTLIKPNTIGITARGRKTYNRNLEPNFYLKLINLLEKLGYNIVWLGEKQNCQPCPKEGILDFSQQPEARDLENTLAIVSQCDFTIQFFTASSRLAGMIGTPYILFESPEQIYSTGYFPGQEGRRLEMSTFGDHKLVICQYEKVRDNHADTLALVGQAITELKAGNNEDIIGLVDDKEVVNHLKQDFYETF